MSVERGELATVPLQVSALYAFEEIQGVSFSFNPYGRVRNMDGQWTVNVDQAAARFFVSSNKLMQAMGRGCGNDHLSKFNNEDNCSWHSEIAKLTGIEFAGVKQDKATGAPVRDSAAP